MLNLDAALTTRDLNLGCALVTALCLGGHNVFVIGCRGHIDVGDGLLRSVAPAENGPSRRRSCN